MVAINNKVLMDVGECHVYEAHSTSRPGAMHYVFVFKDKRGIRCTCEGWKFNSKCWHVDAIPLCKESPELGEGSRAFYIPECHYLKDHNGQHSWEQPDDN